VKPFDQIDALQRVSGLDAPAAVLDTLSRVVSKPHRLRRVLAGEPFGHAAHPMLVQVPIGAWVSAGWLDCLPRTEKSAAVLTAVGIASAVPAAAAGLVDYGALDRRDRRIAVVHGAANTLSLVCQIVSLRDRVSGRLRRGQWIGFAGTLTLAVGGMLGGHLAHKLPGDRATAGADKHV
jgi:uncharacterized membrane protein